MIIKALIVGALLIVGLVALLKRMGASPMLMIVTALVAGQILGMCIGTCFGAVNYFDNQDPRIVGHEPGYHAASPYYTTPQSTTVYGWSAITAALGNMWRWGMAELGF